MGSVPIVEYHEVVAKDDKYARSIRKFKGDLARMWKMGFRPVTLTQYLDDKMDLPPGASPIVFTFDDSRASQFRLIPGKDGKPELDPRCALGLWQYFATQHPDFPVRATFFILPNTGPWGPKADVDAKLKMIKDWGCELGSHTITHTRMDRMNAADITKELEEANAWIKEKGFDPQVIALPFGISPKDPSILKKYYRAALLVGANPAPSPKDPKRNLMRLPRIQSVESPFGLTYWLDQIEKGATKPYVAP